ncbi:CGNR zinc finger domain-containing protein [Mycolicibacterium sediminis]|uniref:Zinc finger CGNR domain-containing protein n=1 Tax=Mycolicibacterium sediminis TaxID=1286180 RepID=A0A7I7QV07_9MYCO|nr:CGNR zinc finger domain-containing protein [Mycolicibacterium sediminis]BBY30112.1 hypothetical protein MSEDJ_42080 [Mycolicibacterium sediminis]
MTVDDDEAKPAPGRLRLVQALINSVDRESGRDRLSTVDSATPWLTDTGLLTTGATLDADHLALVVGVREALHALVMGGSANHDAAVLRPLRDVARTARLRADLDPTGTVTVAPAGESVADRLAGLLAVVADAQRDGTWGHLKACANEDCRWVFYDRSRNHGGTWCDMSTCGNKVKNREFRARRRAGT